MRDGGSVCAGRGIAGAGLILARRNKRKPSKKPREEEILGAALNPEAATSLSFCHLIAVIGGFFLLKNLEDVDGPLTVYTIDSLGCRQ